MPGIYHYMLTGRGLGSEVNNLLFAVHYARTRNATFVLCDKYWNARIKMGWEDYFEQSSVISPMSFSFRTKLIEVLLALAYRKGVNPGNLLFRWNEASDQKLGKLKWLLEMAAGRTIKLFFPFFHEARQEAGELMARKPEEFKADLHGILLSIWNLKPDILTVVEKNAIKQEYVCVHIRRGDKVTTGEDIRYSIDDYIIRIEDLNLSSRKILVLCDDYRAFRELSRALPQYDCTTNTPPTAAGHEQDRFNAKTGKSRYNDTVRLIVDIELARRATHFIGSHHSNIYRLLEYFRLEGCFSVAPDFRNLI